LYKAKQIFQYDYPKELLNHIPTFRKIDTIDSLKDIAINCRIKNLTVTVPQRLEIIYDSIYNDNARLITFGDSSTIIITYDSNIKELNYMKHFQEIDKNINKDMYKKYFAKNNIVSNYQFLKHIFNLSPKDIKLYDSNSNIILKYTILKFKEMAIASGYDRHFSNFETNVVKGFQFGAPGTNKDVIIYLFDKKDYQYSIIFIGKYFTQDLIDQIIRNIKVACNVLYQNKDFLNPLLKSIYSLSLTPKRIA
jgi:hypothetical protein